MVDGCGPTEPEPAKPEQLRTVQAQIKAPESTEIEPALPELAEQEPVPAEPNQVEVSDFLRCSGFFEQRTR